MPAPADLEMHAKKTNSCKTTPPPPPPPEPPVTFTWHYSGSVSTGAANEVSSNKTKHLTMNN